MRIQDRRIARSIVQGESRTVSFPCWQPYSSSPLSLSFNIISVHRPKPTPMTIGFFPFPFPFSKIGASWYHLNYNRPDLEPPLMDQLLKQRRINTEKPQTTPIVKMQGHNPFGIGQEHPEQSTRKLSLCC